MSQQVACTGCQRTLVVPDGGEGPWITCPKCLERVPNPVAVEAAFQADRPRRNRCPHCGRDVERMWRTCPFCEEPLRGFDVDVRRDTGRTSALLIVLAVFGVLGVALTGWTVTAAAWGPGGDPTPLYGFLIGLVCLVGVTTLIVFLRTGGRPGAEGVRRVVVGSFAAAGGFFIIGFLLAVAAFVFLLAICFTSGGKC
jgi:hypothetical protein